MSNTPYWVWACAYIAGGLCLLAFLALDPAPSLLLAASAGLNAGILIWSGYQCYELRILLSPVGQILIGPGLIFYYSIGNLGARMAGEARFAGNPGSLDYYPLASAFSTLGVLLFCLVAFFVMGRYLEEPRLGYEDLEWAWWQGIVATALAAAVLVYLSGAHPFVNGYFRNVGGQLDLWLSASVYYFSLLAILVNTSVLAKAVTPFHRIVSFSCLSAVIGQSVLLRSRTFMAVTILMSLFAYLTIRPGQLHRTLGLALAGIALVFALGTVVKGASGASASILDNLTVLQASDASMVRTLNDESSQLDQQYRLAGLEMPAALLACFAHGATPMYGEGMAQGLLQGLPNFLRPAGEYSERIAITRHFENTGLLYGDAIGVPLASGLADWGAPGILIYAVMAVYAVVLWRVCQWSPRLLTALLMTGNGMYFFDLFWENNGLFAIRTIGFSWLVLLVFGPLLAPKVASRAEREIT
jgi:hypothetical protein